MLSNLIDKQWNFVHDSIFADFMVMLSQVISVDNWYHSYKCHELSLSFVPKGNRVIVALNIYINHCKLTAVHNELLNILSIYDEIYWNVSPWGELSKAPANCSHYSDVIVSAMVSQITSLTIVYSTVYSGADLRKHQSSTSLDFVWGIHRWIPHTKGQWRGKCFHLMTSSRIMHIEWYQSMSCNFWTKKC